MKRFLSLLLAAVLLLALAACGGNVKDDADEGRRVRNVYAK